MVLAVYRANMGDGVSCVVGVVDVDYGSTAGGGDCVEGRVPIATSEALLRR